MSNSISTDRFLCFSLSAEKFAIPLLQVKEVVALQKITPLPQSPNYIKGIINLRGQVISIVDLGLKLKNAALNADEKKTIIILDFASIFIGVIVDSVDSVADFNQETISAVQEIAASVKNEYLTGVAARKGDMVLLIDLKKVFGIKEELIERANMVA